jgi:hypothetical protein
LQKEESREEQANRYSWQHIFFRLVGEIQGKPGDDVHQDQIDEKYDKVEQHPAISGFKDLPEINLVHGFSSRGNADR